MFALSPDMYQRCSSGDSSLGLETSRDSTRLKFQSLRLGLSLETLSLGLGLETLNLGLGVSLELASTPAPSCEAQEITERPYPGIAPGG